MTSDNIHKTCALHGYVTPCAGAGGRKYHPVPDANKVKGIKAAFGNAKSYVGLRDPASSLCQIRYGSGGRLDARCGDGWEAESKTAGKPVCEDDNTNKDLPCAMIKDSCTEPVVQAKCALTCGTFSKGSKECKMIAKQQDAYKCVRSFSCSAIPQSQSQPGMLYLKPRPKNTNGCGKQLSVDVSACSSDSTSCGCNSAYFLQARSISRSDCAASAYATEGKAIVAKLESMAAQSTKWASTCTAFKSSHRPYMTKALPVEPLNLKSDAQTVWQTKNIHSLTVTREAGGCHATFTMALSVCSTAPFKHLTMDVPFTGTNVVRAGCGCQEVLAKAAYSGQIRSMPNMMRATQEKCAAQFAKWNLEFQKEYFFDGMGYRAEAVRIAKEIRNQCRNPGSELDPGAKIRAREEAIAHASKQNKLSVKSFDRAVQQAKARVFKLQREKAQCLAKLPRKADNYKQLTNKLATEPNQQTAAELTSELHELKSRLGTRDVNEAKLKIAKGGQ